MIRPPKLPTRAALAIVSAVVLLLCGTAMATTATARVVQVAWGNVAAALAAGMSAGAAKAAPMGVAE